MSSFSVEIVRLDDVLVHPNADALELAQIGGYRAVVQKGLHKKGDKVVYVPEQAILPQPLIDAFGFTGKLAGSQKNRVKAIRLRGELSQGLVLPLVEVLRFLNVRGNAYPIRKSLGEQEGQPLAVQYIGPFDSEDAETLEALVGGDLTEALGIIKYEEPIPVSMQGRARPRPDWFPTYTDIENIKRYNRSGFELGEQVVMTEKLHGTNFGVGLKRSDEDITVSSRRMVLLRDETNLYWRAAIENNVTAVLQSILALTGAETAVIWGEIFGPGVQDLTYGVEQNKIGFRWFDVMIEGQYVDNAKAVRLLSLCGATFPRVPVLFEGPFSEKRVEEVTTGKDTLSGSHVREGVVIKPVVERRAGNLGRLILKSVSADYLLRKNGTERQ